jgi:hypothetical protein
MTSILGVHPRPPVNTVTGLRNLYTHINIHTRTCTNTHLDIKDNLKTSILLHIYNSGVVFFFVTCPDTQLSVAEESRVAAQCGEIYTCLASVC